MVRLALQFQLGPPGVETARRLGLSLSGQTVKGLIKEVEKKGVSDKVIVLIGTNDVLQAAKSPSPRLFLRALRGFLEHLRRTLTQRCSQVVFLTVPLVPRLLGHKPDSSKWVSKINQEIQSWHNGHSVIVVPTDELVRLPSGKPDLSLFARFMGKGPNKRTDLIHFNKAGNRVLWYLLNMILCDPVV